MENIINISDYNFISLKNSPQFISEAAEWFCSKWNIPVEAYTDSMNSAIHTNNGIPAWYIIKDEHGGIIAGLGVIENDFHKRPDLTPNICAVYVDKAHRRRGIARKLLNHAASELSNAGIEYVYLITTHTEFYEHCGWEFYDIIEENDGSKIRCYRRRAAKQDKIP